MLIEIDRIFGSLSKEKKKKKMKQKEIFYTGQPC